MGVIHFLRNNWSWKRIKKNIAYIIENDLYEREYIIKDEAVEDSIYEYDQVVDKLKKLVILDDVQSVDKLLYEPKSFSRFGDGEISIIQGHDTAFQQYEPELARKLTLILSQKRDDLYVGLNSSYFQSPTMFSERNHKFYRMRGTEYRRFFIDICDPHNLYLDACCFGGYFRLPPDYDFDALYKRNKSIFKNNKIAIVEVDRVFNNIQYDLFDEAKEKKVIYAPSKNAFSKYKSILYEIESSVSKDYIVCLILGMTATVLAADLTDRGYIAWDIGHMAKDYDAYMKKLDKTDENMDKFWDPD